MPNRYDPYWNNDEYHPGDAPFQFPWWAILLAFFSGGFMPLAIIMLIVNSVLRTQPAKRTRTASQPGAAVYERPAPAKKAAPKPVDEPRDDKLARILIIAGAAVAAVGLIAAAGPVGGLLTGASLGRVLEDLMAGLVMLGGGLCSLLAGLTKRTNARMRKKIAKVVGKADHMYIADIAAAIPCNEKRCIRHLENCIDKGVFGPDAYLDMRTDCLVVRGPAPTPQRTAPEKAPAAAPQKPAADRRYTDILQELRRLNDAIPGDEMSDKISRLEAVSARIFEQAEHNPDKLPQMRKFMDYYLPTSLKLLRTYAELDAQGVEGENIRLSKQRIEKTMDTLVVAFENQLDQLFSADALDVSADIEVMENMLRADGLATGGDSPAAPRAPHLEL